MLVDESDCSDIDLAYRYAQVGIDETTIDWNGNCGNLAGAVGVYGILAGLVEPTTVRIYSENTDSLLEQEVPVTDRKPDSYGTRRIDGVFGSGAWIPIQYLNPCDGMLGAALPIGRPTNTSLMANCTPSPLSTRRT